LGALRESASGQADREWTRINDEESLCEVELLDGMVGPGWWVLREPNTFAYGIV